MKKSELKELIREVLNEGNYKTIGDGKVHVQSSIGKSLDKVIDPIFKKYMGYGKEDRPFRITITDDPMDIEGINVKIEIGK